MIEFLILLRDKLLNEKLGCSIAMFIAAFEIGVDARLFVFGREIAVGIIDKEQFWNFQNHLSHHCYIDVNSQSLQSKHLKQFIKL